MSCAARQRFQKFLGICSFWYKLLCWACLLKVALYRIYEYVLYRSYINNSWRQIWLTENILLLRVDVIVGTCFNLLLDRLCLIWRQNWFVFIKKAKMPNLILWTSSQNTPVALLGSVRTVWSLALKLFCYPGLSLRIQAILNLCSLWPHRRFRRTQLPKLALHCL